MRPDFVVSIGRRRTLHAAFHVSNHIVRVACRGVMVEGLQKWDYRYRGGPLCRHAACREGFAELDAADRGAAPWPTCGGRR